MFGRYCDDGKGKKKGLETGGKLGGIAETSLAMS
jgi:hypothetical protein